MESSPQQICFVARKRDRRNDLADGDEDLVQMGIVEITLRGRIENPEVVPTPDKTGRFPKGIRGDHNSRRHRDDSYGFSGLVVEAVLILVEDEDVMAGVALVIISVEEIIPLGLVSAPVFPTDRTKRVPFQGEGKSSVMPSLPLF